MQYECWYVWLDVCNRERDEMDIELQSNFCFREHKSPQCLSIIAAGLYHTATFCCFTLSFQVLCFSLEPQLTHLIPSILPQQFLGGKESLFLVASMFPHCTCVRSVHFHFFLHKSKQLVTDWNTAFCFFPCCTDNSLTHTHTHTHTCTHAHMHTHTVFFTVMHPCFQSESHRQSMKYPKTQ